MFVYIMIFPHNLLLLALSVLLCLPPLHAHIPAQPSNNSFQLVNTSTFHLQWYTNGSDWEQLAPLSLRPASNISPGGPAQGIFVHFTEDSAGNDTTTSTTPWIAFVSCDDNSSQESDIFTVAWGHGAKSAILYSLYSETCVINPGYRSPLDVFTTQSLNASLRIEYEFGQFGPSSENYYGYFNATMLNNAAGLVNDTIAVNYPIAPGFLFATLQADDTNGTRTTDPVNGSTSQNTGIAMIVLYAITGCVSALFCAVIISGAIRAIRYPERYGPRAADPASGGGQSRARGLGRAILDTFPVVKFGSGNDQESNHPLPKDVESMEMGTESDPPLPVPRYAQLSQLNSIAEHDERVTHHDGFVEEAMTSAAGQGTMEDPQASEGMDQADMPPRRNRAEKEASRAPPEVDAGMPESIGRETCPICIVDFEEGDDLRVLPCEGKHRFHQSCVDPWLLELSASCPICRQDFRALQTIISGESDGEPSSPTLHSGGGISTTQNRFSRYLRFARRRQRGSTISGDEIPPSSPVGSST